MISYMFDEHLHPLEVTTFPDNTRQVWGTKITKEALQKSGHVAIIWDWENDGEIFLIWQLVQLIEKYARDIMVEEKDFSNKTKVTLSVPYFPYARQDKPVSNETTFALDTFTKSLYFLNFFCAAIDFRIETCILHNPKLTREKLSGIQIHETFPKPDYLINEIMLKREYDTLVLPDAGAAYRFKEYAEAAKEAGLNAVTANKVRDQLTGNITLIDLGSMASTGRKCLILDDICDGGGTFIGLSQILKSRGVEHVGLFVGLGIFSKGRSHLFLNGIDSVYYDYYLNGPKDVTLRAEIEERC